MNRFFLSLLAISVLSAAAYSQNRTFDNFDRSQGVPIYLAPKPLPPVKTTSKRGKGRRVGVVVEDRLAKKSVTRTGMTAAVSDGLALREGVATFGSPKLAMGTSTHLKGFTTGSPLHDSYIVDSSRRYDIDPLLIYAQMHQESSFKLNARSHKGASGLMQLMPATARRFGVTSIYDPKQNIDARVKYMRWLLNSFTSDVVLVLVGCQAGEGGVMKYGGNVPPYRETQEYVRRISARYNASSDPRYVQSARLVSGQSAANLGRKE